MKHHAATPRLASLLLLLALPACGLPYVLEGGYHQAALLAARVPLDEARASGDLAPHQLQAIDRVEDVKAWGIQHGLANTGSYSSVALGWDRTVYNVSAARPLAFEQRTWWFPITGAVPYLGFFSLQDALDQAQDLRDDGWEVWIRTVGAWSTLGWFDDPLLPHMLDWDLVRLTNTVLHEMTHATVWVEGGVRFNESFASFVGDVAAMRYLHDRFGPTSPEVLHAQHLNEDDQRWIDLLARLYDDLQRSYDDPDLTPDARLASKRDLLASLPRRVLLAGFHDPTPYLFAAVEGPWNNARLAQFKDYNADTPAFQALLDQHDGDLLAFIHAVQRLTEDADDPFQALRQAAGYDTHVTADDSAVTPSP